MKKLLGAVLLATSAHAASFDCTKAATAVEKMVCASPRISALDEELASTWREARKLGAVTATQAAWLKQRNACEDDECVESAYLGRIAALRLAHPSLWARQSPPASIFGRYTDRVEACFHDEEARDGIRCEGSVDSVLTLSRGKGNAVTLLTELFFFNGHQCSLEATGEWTGTELRVPSLDESAERQCVLVIRFSGRTATMADVGGACRNANCGVRGSFDTYTLKKVTARPQKK